MYSQVNIKNFHVLPVECEWYLCVLYGFQNKQLCFPDTALADWFLYKKMKV